MKVCYTLRDLQQKKIAPYLPVYNLITIHLFDEIRYELNGVEIDRTRQLGIATEIKNFISLNQSESKSLKNSGWNPITTNLPLVSGHLNFCLPLKILLGFAED